MTKKKIIPKYITTDDKITDIQPANGTDFSLEECQALVGGMVEVCYPPSSSGAILIINEEGKLEGLPLNKIATRLWKEHDPSWPDFIVGNAILMPTEYFK